MKTPNRTVVALALLWAQFPPGTWGAPDPCKDADRVLGGSRTPDSWRSGLLNEAKFRAKGHGDEVKGLDRVSEWIDLADALRRGGVERDRRHIPFFEQLSVQHLEFARSGVRAKSVGRFEEGFDPKALDDLEEEARDHRAEGSMTYSWWWRWNFRLAKAYGYLGTGASPSSRDRFPLDCSLLEEKFPAVVLMPFSDDGVGCFVFNRLHLSRIYPLGLANESKMVHRMRMSPIEYMNHDVSHADMADLSVLRLDREDRLERETRLHLSLLAELDDLPKGERNMVEDGFFKISHELGIGLTGSLDMLAAKAGMDGFLDSAHYSSEDEEKLRLFAETLLRVDRRLRGGKP